MQGGALGRAPSCSKATPILEHMTQELVNYRVMSRAMEPSLRLRLLTLPTSLHFDSFASRVDCHPPSGPSLASTSETRGQRPLDPTRPLLSASYGAEGVLSKATKKYRPVPEHSTDFSTSLEPAVVGSEPLSRLLLPPIAPIYRRASDSPTSSVTRRQLQWCRNQNNECVYISPCIPFFFIPGLLHTTLPRGREPMVTCSP